MKAQRTQQGKIVLFRPEENAARLQAGGIIWLLPQYMGTVIIDKVTLHKSHTLPQLTLIAFHHFVLSWPGSVCHACHDQQALNCAACAQALAGFSCQRCQLSTSRKPC